VTEPLLSISALTKSFGGLVATDNVSLDVGPDEVHAIIGPNGAGKTTFISQISGNLRLDGGSIRFNGADITRLPTPRRARLGLARSFQITSIFRDVTVEDNVAMAVQAHDGHSFRFWRDARSAPALRDPARAVLKRVGLADRGHVIAGALAHGEQRQLELAMALATGPAMLLLDEPMAGMGTEESLQMVALLQELKGSIAMLLVEHDMDAVFALADRITVLVRGQAIATGTPEAIRDNADVRDAYLGEDA
jgi:branched-chain amino acid transport system ATP-binding protein